MTAKFVAFPLIAVVFLVTYSLLTPIVQGVFANIPAPADLPSLPRTKHAETAHALEAWNAVTIADYMGNCPDQVKFMCNDNAIKYFCPAPDGKGLLGLLVSNDGFPMIITGFKARASFWQNKLMCKQVK